MMIKIQKKIIEHNVEKNTNKIGKLTNMMNTKKKKIVTTRIQNMHIAHYVRLFDISKYVLEKAFY